MALARPLKFIYTPTPPLPLMAVELLRELVVSPLHLFLL